MGAAEAAAEAAAAAAEEVVKQPNFPHWHEPLIVLFVALVSALASECTYVCVGWRHEAHTRGALGGSVDRSINRMDRPPNLPSNERTNTKNSAVVVLHLPP